MPVTNSETKIETVLKKLEKQVNKIFPLKADITIPEDRQKIIQFISNNPEQFVGLIHSVGITSFGPFEKTPVEFIEKQVNTNLTSTILLTREMLPFVLQKKSQKNSVFYIGYVSSTTAVTGIPFFGAYAATKAGADMFFRSLKYELPDTIKILVIRPGGVKTPFYEAAKLVNNADIKGLLKETEKTFITPEKVADKLVNAIERRKEGIIYPDLATKLQVKIINSRFIGKKLMKSYSKMIARYAIRE